MDPWLIVVFLSLLPIGELRAAIPYGIAHNLDPFTLYFIAVVFNSVVIFIIWFILDFFHDHFMKIPIYSKLFNKYITRARKKLEHKVGTNKETFGIFLLTAIPLPLTGAYTASILSWFFNINRKKAARAIILGILTAGLIVMALALGLWEYLF